MFLRVEGEEVTVDDSQSPHELESDGSGETLQPLRAKLEALRAENLELREQLDQEKSRCRELWCTDCQCLVEYDELVVQQKSKIRELKGLLTGTGPRPVSPVTEGNSHAW